MFPKNRNLLLKYGHYLPEPLQRYHKETSLEAQGVPSNGGKGLLKAVNAL